MSPDDAKAAFSAQYLGREGINSVGIQLDANRKPLIVVGAAEPQNLVLPAWFGGYEVKITKSQYIRKLPSRTD